MQNSLSGFTIVELLISMLIASLVMTLIWNVYFILGDYHTLIENKSRRVIDQKKMEYLLTRDFIRATALQAGGGEVSLYGTDTVLYRFSDVKIARSFRGFVEEVALGGRFETQGNDRVKVCLYALKETEVCLHLQLANASERSINGDL